MTRYAIERKSDSGWTFVAHRGTLKTARSIAANTAGKTRVIRIVTTKVLPHEVR